MIKINGPRQSVSQATYINFMIYLRFFLEVFFTFCRNGTHKGSVHLLKTYCKLVKI